MNDTLTRALLTTIALVALAPACATVSTTPPVTTPPPVETEFEPLGPVNGVACAGELDAPPTGAQAVSDPELLRSALGETDKGSLCMGLAYEATAPIKVYRVWNTEKSYTELGRWWSFERPEGPREEYREKNAICPEWSALDVMSVCELKVGARFAVGPGQSAQCEETRLPKSNVQQVFIPNDTRKEMVFVENCQNLGGLALITDEDAETIAAWPNAT